MKSLKLFLVALVTLFTVTAFSQTNHVFNTSTITGTYTNITVTEDDTITIVSDLGGTDTYSVVVDGNSSTTGTKMDGEVIWSGVIDNTYSSNFTLTVSGSVNMLHGIMLDVTVNPNTVGIDDVSSDITFSVFPNPTTDYLNLTGGNIESVKVFNMNGQIVLSNTYNTTDVKLDVTNLTNGFYMVFINDSKPIRFVKN